MKQTVYIETSVISYLCGRDSRDIVTVARQQITREWWREAFPFYDCFVSPTVLEEISMGDDQASQNRLDSVKELRILGATPEVDTLAEFLLKELEIPEKARSDAYHISYGTIHKVDFLLSWNCKHIANAHVIKKLVTILRDKNLVPPTICTPDELLEEKNERR